MNWRQSLLSHQSINLLSVSNYIRRFHLSNYQILCKKYDLDYSNYPKLNNGDLEEQFVRGSGPGGQAVNKAMNCVVLKHIPSGLVVKCHQTRSLEKNQEIAREILTEKLDSKLNGENSIANQKKRFDEVRSKAMELKKKKLNQLKNEWKKREGLLKEE
ncbi:mitochondrial translation release factor in rescue [Planococcus citri]|uniref:mitochondrial translation release factor in rescue n=1 Tax=Planococcus citri TaxID=170843 RepID=UPI0031F8D543